MKSTKKIYLPIILLFLIVFSSNAQKSMIYGKVVAFDKFPIPYAEISIKKEKLTTTSDSLGNFSIECNIKDKLSIKANGFKSAMVKVKNYTDSININLVFSGSKEEFVSTGYRLIGKEKSSYATSHIDAESNANSNYANIIHLIQAKAPGIRYIDGNFYVRSNNSHTNFNGALIVVNGMTMSTNDLKDIPVQNVKSIDVLKGSATAIYGSRALHGVIIVSLKK